MICAACKHEGDFNQLKATLEYKYRDSGDPSGIEVDDYCIDNKIHFPHAFMGQGIDSVTIYACPECGTLRVNV